MDEKILIEKAQAGDKNALRELVKLYEQTVFNFSFKICRNKERAENTMQETFLSLLKNLKQFKGDSKLSTWLYTVVSNHCLMAARSESKRTFESLEDEDSLIDEKKLTDWRITPDLAAENNELESSSG